MQHTVYDIAAIGYNIAKNNSSNISTIFYNFVENFSPAE
ncbi:hypothetical protein OCHUTO_0725 [Orientia chuto str. Dubai]|uniref:Uncharacterized protein n=1 Tax=Orientia chuto str. Dubai TaxID=1359168 RepID=A0A0F3MMA6_9RICK|nr:hypothetical protein OCHUTO_0725 [Orientia chuto str. Dubai]